MRYLLTILFLIQYAFATQYYVSAAGSGTGTGLSEANSMSWASFNGAGGNVVVAGDIVSLKKGDVFPGQMDTRGGSAGNVVTYNTYSTGANPIISGFTTLSSWTNSSGNIYYATLDVSILHGVTVDGAVKAMGRYPNSGYLNYESHVSNTSLTDNQLTGSPSWVGGEAVIRKARWILDRQPITAHSTTTLTLTALSTYGNNTSIPVDGNGYFIQGDLDCLDLHGEWYYDNAANRLYIYTTTAPSNYVIKASTVEYLNNTDSYVTFNGITFEGGNTQINMQGGGDGITFSGCSFLQPGSVAIHGANNSDILISGNTFSDALNNTILLQGTGTNRTITGNTVTNSGHLPGMGASGDGTYTGIFVENGNVDITLNSVTNTGYNGIQFTGDNVLIQKNLVNTFCYNKDDGAGIYTVISGSYSEASDRTIDQNIVINATGAYAGAEGDLGEPQSMAAGIYLDDFTNNVTVSNNIVLSSKSILN